MHTLNINGEKITDMQEILNYEVQFYKDLYSSNNIDDTNINSMLNNTVFETTLSKDDADICDGQISLDEITKAIFNMKHNKSPGLSGISIEFYQTFWNKIKYLVLNSMNEGSIKGEQSPLQKQGVISLLYKKGNPENLENWRPISLLNTDYKIITRVLATRLQKLLPKIISMDQQGYLKNRYIGYNIRQIQDIIDYTEKLDIEGAILFLDFRKAFDTVSWNFLFSVLKKFGFNQSFIDWIKTIYNNCSSSIMNNGWRSNFFNLHKGLRQGCPSSALLFILVAEVMAFNIRNNENIHGIKVTINNIVKNIKLTQLADDTTLFLSRKEEIGIALDIIETFGKHSWLILNRNKTEGLWIGKLKSCLD